MAYISFRHIRLHNIIYLCFLIAAPAYAKRPQPKTADVTYFLHGAPVSVPASLQQPGNEGFMVTGSIDTITAALNADRWIEKTQEVAQSAEHIFVCENNCVPARYDALKLIRLAQSSDGHPAFWVFPQSKTQPAQPAALCLLAADEPWTLFTHGLAQVGWAYPQSGNGEGVLWVDLRHAASELSGSWTRSMAPSSGWDGGEDATCTAPVAGSGDAHTLTVQQVAQSVVWHSAVHGKRLALTFDACSTFNYGPFNPKVIAALNTLGVPATLFVGGHWAEMHPKELQALAKNPLFEIGNHTYSHPHMRDLEPWQQAQELRWTQSLIYNQTGVIPTLFRPPYGEVDDAMLMEVARAGLTTVEYDLPAGDADVHISPLKLTQWVVGQASAGSIVIMHMNRPKNHTAQALPAIVEALRSKGYVFCQMSDLLHGDGSQCR